MTEKKLLQLFACPYCHNYLRINFQTCYCKNCNRYYKKRNTIWEFLKNVDSLTSESKKMYEKLFSKGFGPPQDASYEVLSKIAKGNTTVDIGCGVGIIEELVPTTVAVDFSRTALLHAKKKGAKFLVQADAHALPFVDDAFEVAISAGNLEHFSNPLKALEEMGRISKMQVIIAHKFPPIPFPKTMFKVVSQLFQVTHQPIEHPFTKAELHELLQKAHLTIVFDGLWTLPFNYGRVIKYLPEFKSIPSAFFVITTKT